MKTLLTVALLFVALLVLLPAPAVAALDSPVGSEDTPVEDITTDFESLPDHFGLGAVVALVVVLARMLKLPDGWGGYAGVAVGIFAYVASVVLPEASRDTLFEGMNHAARLLAVILGSQVTHRSLKYAGLDWLWKKRDG